MPNVGYGTNKKDRHVLPNGFKKVRCGGVLRRGAAAGCCCGHGLAALVWGEGRGEMVPANTDTCQR